MTTKTIEQLEAEMAELIRLSFALEQQGLDKGRAESASAIATLTTERDAARQALADHQAISDELANRASAAMDAGDLAALPAIIADAKLFGNAREKAKLQAEAAAKTAEAAALTAQAEAL